MKNKFLVLFVVLAVLLAFSGFALASVSYTPLFDSSFFDGVKSDVVAGSVGWLGVVTAIAGAGLIIKVLFFR